MSRPTLVNASPAHGVGTFLVGALGLALLGCSAEQSSAVSSPPEPDAPSAEALAKEAVPLGPHAHMQQHLDAVILGDVDAARGPLSWLATHTPPGDQLPRGWQVYIKAMQDEAAKGATAQSVPEAAGIVSSAARECGACHQSMGAKLSFPEVPMPGGDGIVRHMARHQWAADRMWEGIIQPDGERWRSGAMALLEEPLQEVGLPGIGPTPDAVADVGARVHDLGEKGLGEVDEAAQVALYAKVLTACGTCHSVAGGGPNGGQ